MCTSVHTEPSSATTEAVALGTELPAMADLAVEHPLVAVQVCGVKCLVAHAAFETFLVEGEFSNFPGFSSVYGFFALGALDLFGGLERHLGGLLWITLGKVYRFVRWAG